MKKVITYGTYDLFHQGHYNIIKRAKEYGDYLIVGVTGDSYDIGRGKLSVKDSLATRIENVKNTGLVDEIIVEEYLGQKISDIIKYNIDTFVIGDDWRGKFDHLNKYCDVVYLERTKNISSTQLREENFTKYNIGIIADQLDDNQIVKEAKLVSGFEVTSVYSEDEGCSVAFQKKYELNKSYTELDSFFDTTDIVYIRTNINSRYRFIKEALNAGKHVICDPPFTLSKSKQEELFELAAEKKCILIDNVKMVYVRVFNQLLWMTHGGLIGKIVKFNCSVSKMDKNINDLFYGLTAMALCPMIKIMGTEYHNMTKKIVEGNDNIEFASLNFEYDNAEATIHVGNEIRVENKIEIIGTQGTIRLKDNWWKSNCFELEKVGYSEPEIYNMNFSGNGFMFLIYELSTMLKNGRTESMGLFNNESIKITEIIESINERDRS